MIFLDVNVVLNYFSQIIFTLHICSFMHLTPYDYKTL
jgi:hypothetical protein